MEYWSVEEWLETIGMSQYSEAFVDNGYETVELVCNMGVEDLDAVGVVEKKHRGILFTHAELLLKETSGAPAQLSPKPVITVTINSPTSPNNNSTTEGYTEPWVNKPTTPVSSTPQDYCEPWTSITMPPTTPSNPDNGTAGGYVEPWDNTTSPVLPQRSDYAEPWTGPKPSGTPSHVTEAPDGIESKAPPLPPPNKPKGRKPTPSPRIKLPEYKRDESEKGLTKLQLKLKIRGELIKDAIVLSEHPYCNKDGSINGELLLDLAADYAVRFGVESLNVYDALDDVWRVSNTSSEFVTPSKPLLQGGPTDNYDEPFDTTVKSSLPLKVVSSGSPKELKSSGKSQTLPPNQATPTYEEPFDTVIVSKSPQSSPQKTKGDQYKTMPSPTTPTKPTAEAKKEHLPSRGLSRFARKKDKSRSHSVREDNTLEEPEKKNQKSGRSPMFPKLRNTKKKRSSADESIPDTGRSREGSKLARASVAGFPVSNGKSAHRGGSMDSASSGPSEFDESPSQKKRHSGNVFSKLITPPLSRNQAPEYTASVSSDSDSTPPALRKLKVLGNNRMTGSDLELNNQSDNNDTPGWMVASKSYNNLADTCKDDAKPDKKKGFFKRLVILRKSMKLKKSKATTVTSNKLAVSDRVSSLTASISMPDIAGLSTLKNIPPSISEEHTPQPRPSHRHNSADQQNITIPIITSAPINIDPPKQRSDTSLPLSPTTSNGSVKSLDKPLPPPKPATLTRRTRSPNASPTTSTLKISDLEKSGEIKHPSRFASDGIPQRSTGYSNTLPLKPVRKRSNEQPKVESIDKKSISIETISSADVPKESRPGPPKPARKSIKRSVVPEQKKQHIPDSKNDTDQPLETPPKPGHTPPPKPSRNYKSIRILPQPPGKPVKPVKLVKTLSAGNVKPSEMLKRSRSPLSESADQPAKSGAQQFPKRRTSVETSKKQSPPNPPRTSIKLKTMD